MQIMRDEIKNILIPEPGAGLLMHLDRRWVEYKDMPSVLQRAGVFRNKLRIRQDGEVTAGLKGLWHLLPIEGGRLRFPRDRFLGIGLSECLEQPNPLRSGCETVDIVEHDRFI